LYIAGLITLGIDALLSVEPGPGVEPPPGDEWLLVTTIVLAVAAGLLMIGAIIFIYRQNERGKRLLAERLAQRAAARNHPGR
jgi:hypothetical protein